MNNCVCVQCNGDVDFRESYRRSLNLSGDEIGSSRSGLVLNSAGSDKRRSESGADVFLCAPCILLNAHYIKRYLEVSARNRMKRASTRG